MRRELPGIPEAEFANCTVAPCPTIPGRTVYHFYDGSGTSNCPPRLQIRQIDWQSTPGWISLGAPIIGGGG